MLYCILCVAPKVSVLFDIFILCWKKSSTVRRTPTSDSERSFTHKPRDISRFYLVCTRAPPFHSFGPTWHNHVILNQDQNRQLWR